jgi:hypothetical protein
MGKYDPLRDHLARQPGTATTVAMSFTEIESLVGRLPDSARNHRAWWGNDSRVQCAAWQAAGWHVSSLSHLREWVVFCRVNLGGHPARQPDHAPDDSYGPGGPTFRQSPTGAGTTEESVRSLLVDDLVRQGWQIRKVAGTAAREYDIDVLASREGRILAVVVEGYPAGTYADPRRATGHEPTSPAAQARHWYAQAILKAMLIRGDHPDYDLAMAFPEATTYRTLTTRSRSCLDRLDIRVLFVSPDGQVQAV